MKGSKVKDYFSVQASAYAAFRPSYPSELYDFIFRYLKTRDQAWDCATGNGQAARYLARHFNRVYATDISQKQLDEAAAATNITYSLSPAETTSFGDQQFDLVTVGQAIHWFDREKFYKEVKRVTKSGGLLAVWGYALMFVDEKVDRVIGNFYDHIVGPYWDEARRLVEQEYKSIEFPFEEIEAPEFYITVEWSLSHLAGYLSSWSATQKYIKTNHVDPVPDVVNLLNESWKTNEIKTVRFPVFLKLGRV